MNKPFIINSNILTSHRGLSSLESIKNTIAQNSGNSYIAYSIIKMLSMKLASIDDIKSFYFPIMENIADLANHINQCHNSVIIIFQDQLCGTISYNYSIHESIIELIDKIEVPICTMSLGANSLGLSAEELSRNIDIKTQTLLKKISKKGGKFGVRGEYTADVLFHLGIKNAEVVGCPTWFETGAERVLKRNEVDEPSILYSSPYHKKLGFFTADAPAILQDEWEDINKIYFEKNSLHKNEDYFFTSMRNWKDYVKKFDFVAGTRVHGAILAINAGVPAIITSGDMRSKEMCDLFCIPRYPGVDLSDIKNYFDTYDSDSINYKYGILYKKFKEFVSYCGLGTIDSSPSELLDEIELPVNIRRLKLFYSDDLSLHFHLPYYNPNSNGISLLWHFANDASKYCKVTISVFSRGESGPITVLPSASRLVVPKSECSIADIVVYSDIIEGNPLEAKRVCRFLLGSRLLFENSQINFGNNDFLFAYSKAISDHLPQLNFNNPELKRSDLRVRTNSNSKLHIAIYYGKCRYFKFDKKKLQKILKSYNLPIKIITRTIPESKDKLNQLISSSALLVSFDPLTNLAYEATLMGVPVLFVDCAFKDAFNKYNHKLHGYYFLDDVSKRSDINDNPESLSKLSWFEYYNVEKSYTAAIHNILQMISRHFSKDSINDQTLISKYLAQESEFFENVWRKSPLFLCSTRKSVVKYHILNMSTTSIFTFPLFMFICFPVFVVILLANRLCASTFAKQILNKHVRYFATRRVAVIFRRKDLSKNPLMQRINFFTRLYLHMVRI